MIELADEKPVKKSGYKKSVSLPEVKGDDMFDLITDNKQTEKVYTISPTEIIIELEATIATAQYENLKPKISMKLSNISEIPEALSYCRKVLREQYAEIKAGMK